MCVHELYLKWSWILTAIFILCIYNLRKCSSDNVGSAQKSGNTCTYQLIVWGVVYIKKNSLNPSNRIYIDMIVFVL